MKYIDSDKLDEINGNRLAPEETFTFDCHPEIACFNRCCRNINLFLYPYDVIRLKNRLGLRSGQFIDRYVDVVLRPGSFFPEVVLKMQDEGEQPCSFLTPQGCGVYTDRPDTCRKFPLEQGLLSDRKTGRTERVYFFKPPDFCFGPREPALRSAETWNDGPDDRLYDQMTLQWAELKGLLRHDPWGREGPEGSRARMTFMASYNIDDFHDFVFNSSFLKRYKIKPARLKKIKTDDKLLLELAFDWIKYFLWGLKTKRFKPK